LVLLSIIGPAWLRCALGLNRMADVLWGIILCCVAGLVLAAAICWTRHQRNSMRLVAALFSLMFLALGVCHMATGLQHPLMSEATHEVVFTVAALVCVVAALMHGVIEWLKPNPGPTTPLHSTRR
jgi:uncharacterized membrane protein HdeD (DUF308 family)